jgi:hypothetical protein
MKKIKYINILFLFLSFVFLGAVYQSTNASINSSNVFKIVDIKNWKHPVKTIFEKYDIDLLRVELLNKKTYPIFYCDVMLNARYDFNFLNELAKANSYNDYKIVFVDAANINSVEVCCNHTNKEIIKTIVNYDYKTQDINEYSYNLKIKNNLCDKDFEVYYKKFIILKNIDTDKFISRFGYGDANDNNNLGHIGTGDDGYERNAFGYEDGNNYIRLIMFNINEEGGGLEGVGVDKTYRKIKFGDSKEKLIKIYGHPNFVVKINIKKDIDEEEEFVYKYSSKELRFYVYQSKVVNIVLQFSNLYKF